MGDWDLVLRGGRVIDPESGLDAVRDVGVLFGYAPAASPAEYLGIAGLAAEAGLPTFTHAAASWRTPGRDAQSGPPRADPGRPSPAGFERS